MYVRAYTTRASVHTWMKETEVEWRILRKFSCRIDGSEADRQRVEVKGKKKREGKYQARASTEMADGNFITAPDAS